VVNPVILVLGSAILVMESCLVYVNYLARVKHKRYFSEGNWVWRFFDRLGITGISLLVHFTVVFAVTLFAMSSPITFGLGALFGLVYMNLIMDYMTYRRFQKCIGRKCPFLEEKVEHCRECEGREHGEK